MNETLKRCSSTSHVSAPPHKSPRTEVQSSIQTPDAGEGHSETDKQEMHTENTEGPSGSPAARRKSWRRATLTRRSLPALPNPYQSEFLTPLLSVKMVSAFVFSCINTYLCFFCFCFFCSFVQEHKYILITAREAGKIDGGFNEGEFKRVILYV